MRLTVEKAYLSDKAQKSFNLSEFIKIDYSSNIITLSDSNDRISFPCIRLNMSERMILFLFLDFDWQTLLQYCNGYVTPDKTKFEIKIDGTEIEELRSIKM